jgi:PAP2 superfamily
VFDQYNTGRPYTFGGFVNEYAAFPSMHFGWNMLVGLALWLATKNPFIRIFAVLMPFGMFTDIILTANHYLLDPIAAIPVVALGLAITLGGRWLVLRVLSPESKAAREHGWVTWVYWLVAIDEASIGTQQTAQQPA